MTQLEEKKYIQSSVGFLELFKKQLFMSQVVLSELAKF